MQYRAVKITNRSFRFASPHLWNQLPVSFRQSPSHSPHFTHGSSCTSSSFLPSLFFVFNLGSKPVFSQVFPNIDFLPRTAFSELDCSLWTPAQRSLSEVHVMFCECYLFIYFLWPPYAPAQVNGGSRNFYTWWTLSVNREVTTSIYLDFFPGPP